MKLAVRSRRKVYGQLLEHARLQPHQECCGILAGQDGAITLAFPAKNAAADPIRNYEIAPRRSCVCWGNSAGGGSNSSASTTRIREPFVISSVQPSPLGCLFLINVLLFA